MDTLGGVALTTLILFLVLAILLENALSTLFNWRVFLTYFSTRGIKTVVMILVGYFIVKTFDLDLIAGLVTAYNSDAAILAMSGSTESITESKFGTQLLSALVLAGGSSGVYNIMRSLGYREPIPESRVYPSPPADKAWVSVTVNRVEAVGPVQIAISEQKVHDTETVTAIAGTVFEKRPGLLTLLLRNKNRFPQNGGYSVQPNTAYRISVTGKSVDGKILSAQVEPGPLVFANRAIADFEVTI